MIDKLTVGDLIEYDVNDSTVARRQLVIVATNDGDVTFDGALGTTTRPVRDLMDDLNRLNAKLLN